MAKKDDLQQWVLDALTTKGGSAKLVDVARAIWQTHEDDLIRSGDLFYTWQYDMRWAASQMRRKGLLKNAGASPSGVWELL
ncbi:hypothetical protein [Polaromonas sp.]|uniref:hypothetical protein n=1 Tax=Polaromonas sp. TaxID=1869339 RepID=UPI0032674C83